MTENQLAQIKQTFDVLLAEESPLPLSVVSKISAIFEAPEAGTATRESGLEGVKDKAIPLCVCTAM